jgi:lipopolysaccharide biosynthesis glycosyltransferase
MNIALAFDQAYVTPFFAAIASIIENNKGELIHFHVIAPDLSNNDICDIKDFVASAGVHIEFYTISNEFVKQLFIHKNSHFTSLAIFYRLFFPHLVSEAIDKILYLDVDTIVVQGLKELFAIDMQSFPVAAVADAWPYDHSSLGISAQDGYFNSGVLLINAQEWRKQLVVERTLEFIGNHERLLSMPDQDALNSILVGNWLKLDKKYNLQFDYIPNPIAKREISTLVAQTVIVHYTTISKPWLLGCANRLRGLYFYYLDKTPHRSKPRYFNSRFSSNTLYKAGVIRLKEYYIDNQWLTQTWRKIKGLYSATK